MYRFYGTENEAKELLANLAKYDKETNINAYDHGTEDIEDVESEGNKLQAYTVFNQSDIDYTYRIDYTAQQLCDVCYIGIDGSIA